MKDIFLSDFSNPLFQTAFQAYFQEIGVQVKEWDRLFQEMTKDENFAYLRLTDAGGVVGFIQFKPAVLSNWFFRMQVGFVREFWIAPGHRGQGSGTELLQLAEAYFREKGIPRSILTTDTAPAFYERNGYAKDPAIVAVNKIDVYVKDL